jgi:hypothetical protein
MRCGKRQTMLLEATEMTLCCFAYASSPAR